MITVTFGHGTFGVGVEQFGAVLDDAPVFLGGSGHEAGNVHEGDDRNVEGVAEAHETRRLDRGLDVEHSRQAPGLIGHDADRMSIHAGEANDDVFA